MTEAETELFSRLAEAFSASRACEVPFHGEDPRGHEGDAVWYVKTHCLHCTAQSDVFAACDKFVEVLKYGTMDMICVPCKTYGAMFAITLLEKIHDD